MWTGTNGLILNCEFKSNSVTYPNHGGAIYWHANNGTIDSSNFVENSAWYGGAIYYSGDNLTINYSYINNNGIMGNDAQVYGSNYYIIHPKANYTQINITHRENNFVNDTPNNETTVNNENKTTINRTTIETPININPKIVNNNDLTIFYKSNTTFTVTIYGSDGNPAIRQIVKFKINNKVISRNSNKNGVASLTIDLKPGIYTVVSEFGGVTATNKIVVKTRLITNDLTKKIKKTANFKVKVLNTNGKSFAKQTINVKFKGKTCKLKTNSKGIATLKLNKKIKAGKYTIKTTYAYLTNTNTLKVKK